MFNLFKKKQSSDLKSEYETKKRVQILENLPKVQEDAKEIFESEGISFTKEVADRIAEDYQSSFQIPNLEERNKKCKQTKNGLYPHEILMLDYAKKYKTSCNDFPGFWLYEYGVKNPQSVLESLCDRNFIVQGGLKDALNQLKLPELKSELSSYGLSSTGKKADLIERLLANVNEKQLDAKFTERYYALTDLGEQELKENEYVIYMHKNKSMFADLGVYGMHHKLFFDNPDNHSFRDLLWAELNRQSMQFAMSWDFGLYRNTRLSMYNFLIEEEKYHDAFARLCEVLYVDLSGMSNEGRKITRKSWLKQMMEWNFPYEKSIATLPPAINRWLKNMKEKLSLESNDDLRSALVTQFSKLTKMTPYHLFTPEECADITVYEFMGDKQKVSDIYKIAEVRVKEQINK